MGHPGFLLFGASRRALAGQLTFDEQIQAERGQILAVVQFYVCLTPTHWSMYCIIDGLNALFINL